MTRTSPVPIMLSVPQTLGAPVPGFSPACPPGASPPGPCALDVLAPAAPLECEDPGSVSAVPTPAAASTATAIPAISGVLGRPRDRAGGTAGSAGAGP